MSGVMFVTPDPMDWVKWSKTARVTRLTLPGPSTEPQGVLRFRTGWKLSSEGRFGGIVRPAAKSSGKRGFVLIPEQAGQLTGKSNDHRGFEGGGTGAALAHLSIGGMFGSWGSSVNGHGN